MYSKDTNGNNYDAIIVGAGHAGCEAALASARMGHRTLLITLNLDTVALMPCNPSVGGPAKGHVVREIDALGGEMARNTDRTSIQIRMLNEGKGPAVQAPRAQCDKKMYAISMKTVLETTPNLDLKQGSVSGLLLAPLNPEAGEKHIAQTLEHTPGAADKALRSPGRLQVVGITTATGREYRAKAVVLTTGTFLRGRVISGEFSVAAGRAGEAPSTQLSSVLGELQFPLMRLKTGTPPRIDARTIDFSLTKIETGSLEPIYFSHERIEATTLEPLDTYPQSPEKTWRPQMACYIVHTTPQTHSIIRENLHRSPMFNGNIEGVGPRYCPSIEDKVSRFADKESHQLFLEPEGWRTNEVYVQGCSTSLPEEVQWRMIRSIPALRSAEIMRLGYAVEYDAVPPNEITAWLETKRVAGLFLAGQINGTSGYEEAAGQGIMAGINAALYSRRLDKQRGVEHAVPPVAAPESAGEQLRLATDEAIKAVRSAQPLVLPRHLAYIGVMLDDLSSKDHREPYRLMTSRAEYRLLLRSDNADLRLTAIGRALGLVGEERYNNLLRKDEIIEDAMQKLRKGVVTAPVAARLSSEGHEPPDVSRHTTMLEYMRRQATPYTAIGALLPELDMADSAVLEAAQEIHIAARLSGYVAKQEAEVSHTRKLEERLLPLDFPYMAVTGLKTEAREKLAHFRPHTVGQASRIAGVTPADIHVLLVHLKQREAR